ncbi:MAG: DUF3223 domain-containing protein [Rubrivivax sp.]|jgi:hypothetical protein|nr:DUF3223 domain-containing protein [Rubrivivax sp.]MDP3611868.1 DUF3223 domain-containing protein [Rubrivivax sp.]
MAKPVQLPNGRQWRTQTEALRHFKEMLGRHGRGDRVSDAQDHADLVALLQRYDALLPLGAETKCGSGISHFSKELNVGEGWVSDGFHVHHVDGTSIDFSYIDAVTGKAPQTHG